MPIAVRGIAATEEEERYPRVRRCTSRGPILELGFCHDPALALPELRLFPISLTRCSPFSDVRCRIAQERYQLDVRRESASRRNSKGRSLRLPHLRQKVAKPRHRPLARDHRGSERTIS